MHLSGPRSNSANLNTIRYSTQPISNTTDNCSSLKEIGGSPGEHIRISKNGRPAYPVIGGAVVFHDIGH